MFGQANTCILGQPQGQDIQAPSGRKNGPSAVSSLVQTIGRWFLGSHVHIQKSATPFIFEVVFARYRSIRCNNDMIEAIETLDNCSNSTTSLV